MAGVSLLDSRRLSVAKAASELGVHVSAIYRWAKGIDGVRLPITRIGGRSYVLVDDLERFVAARSDPKPADDAEQSLADRADIAGRKLEAMGL